MVWKEFGQFETTHGNDLDKEKKANLQALSKAVFLHTGAHWIEQNEKKINEMPNDW